MHDLPSEPFIDLEVRSRDEQDKRIVAPSGSVDVDQLADTVRIQRAGRAQANDREVLRQPGLIE
jgi:hypothetical protein